MQDKKTQDNADLLTDDPVTREFTVKLAILRELRDAADALFLPGSPEPSRYPSFDLLHTQVAKGDPVLTPREFQTNLWEILMYEMENPGGAPQFYAEAGFNGYHVRMVPTAGFRLRDTVKALENSLSIRNLKDPRKAPRTPTSRLTHLYLTSRTFLPVARALLNAIRTLPRDPGCGCVEYDGVLELVARETGYRVETEDDDDLLWFFISSLNDEYPLGPISPVYSDCRWCPAHPVALYFSPGAEEYLNNLYTLMLQVTGEAV